MTHAEFHTAVKRLAGEASFHTHVTIVTTYLVPGVESTRIQYQILIDGYKWTSNHLTPESALEEMINFIKLKNGQDINSVG